MATSIYHKMIPLLLLPLLFLGSCTCPQAFHPDNVPPPLPVSYVPERIRLALVLGGGGAKGLAHIGVLEEFEKAGLPIDLIIGCSAGSLVGAVYADCPNAAYVKRVMEPMKTNWFLHINLWTARYGLSQGGGMQSVLKSKLSCRRFEDLKIPFMLVATDLCSGELVTIGGGELIPAIQASCAIPFVFVPVELHGRMLVDGGVVDPVPVRVARQVDAEVVVAVDLRGLLPKTIPTNLFGVAARSAEITLLWQSETCIHDADIVIRPELEGIGTFEDKCNHRVYEAGRAAARAVIPRIQQLLNDRENERLHKTDEF